LSTAGSTTGSGPAGIAISPNGSCLYVANYGSDSLSAFTIGSDGTLSPITLSTAGSAAGSGPWGIAISPNGSCLYVTNSGSDGSNGLSAYSIGSGGTLSPITLSTAGSTTGSQPWGIAISPNGSYLYVTNRNGESTGSLSAYSIGSTGTLSPITLSAAGSTTGAGPEGIAISPNGSHLYVANYASNSLSAFTIGSNGTLSPITLSTAGSTTGSGGGIAISPNGSYLYVTNGGIDGTNGLSAFTIGPGGTLSPITLSTAGSTTGSYAEGIAISPNGSYLYVTNTNHNGTGSLSAYSIGSDGTLSPITLSSAGSTTGTEPFGIAIMP
jgi:DNA-binding beta-propeller fold protein YncE